MVLWEISCGGTRRTGRRPSLCPTGSAIEQVSLSETQLLLLENQPSVLPTRDLHPKNVGSGLRTRKNPQSGPRIWNDRPQPKGARVGGCRVMASAALSLAA